jgi:phosphoribosylaminoimidazolecarboxamide formyltransferase/IMP cyclohydrolase
MTDHPIKRALLSVYDKAGIVEFARFLASQGIEILSTGGTASLLKKEGVAVKEVSEHTGFPEMLDGRVKTLHPKIHGGLLGRRTVKSHTEAMSAHDIAPIDLVVITLYPFEATVASGAAYDDCVEQIDIGGPAMVRSAAKNHESVTVVTDMADYARVKDAIAKDKGTSLALRKELAGKAYGRTAAYDAAISGWFAKALNEPFPAQVSISGTRKEVLRYGENPHQKAAFYTYVNAPKGIATAKQLQGKELSYNNINDTDAAFMLVSEFSEPAVAIIKHANPCGVATGATLAEAFTKALACDPVSAYGGIIAVNRTLDAVTVEALGGLFLEVIIAPDVEPQAAELLTKKKNLRLLVTGGMADIKGQAPMMKAVSGGFLLQDSDTAQVQMKDVKTVSAREPRDGELEDMLFAFTVAKHVKSNAIVLARNKATIGIGAGQMSRVDSVRIACWKAEEAKLSTTGAVMASDAFFPFADNVHNAAKAGIVALIQPGGSIRDEEVVKAADSYNMAMVLTGVRHFKH